MKNRNTPGVLKKFIYYPISRIVLGAIAIATVTGMVKGFITKPLFVAIAPSAEIAKIIVTTLSVFVMVGVYYLIIKYYEKKPFNEFSKKHAVRELSNGFLLGFLVISIEVGVLYLLGFYEITGMSSFFKFLPTVTFIMGVVMLEEIVFRGILFKILEDWKGTTIALLASSVLFMLPHFMNPHMTVLPAILGTLFGILTALMYVDTKRLWIPFAFHFGWNVAQPALGTTLSGIDDFDGLFQTTIQGPELLTGSAFGIEDSLFTMISLVALIVIYLNRINKKGFWVKRSQTKLKTDNIR